MDGLIIRLLGGRAEHAGRWFWRVFGSIRPDLDRMFWCFSWQPWMGLPSDLLDRLDEFEAEHLEPFENEGATSTQLWRPGSLGLYADHFAEDSIELWAIKPTRDDPARLATEYSRCGLGRNEMDELIRRHSHIWLIYTDSSCWEIYAREAGLLDRIRQSLEGNAAMSVHPSHADRRGQSSGVAGEGG